MATDDWEKLRHRLARPDFEVGRLLVGLDFDGTLAEIAATPAEAALTSETRRLLELLSRRSDTRVAVLSGRALADVRSLIGLPGIYYAGNHGLEIDGPGIRWAHPQAAAVDRSVWRDIEADLKEFPGAFIEHKRLGAAVHYRSVPPRHHKRLRERLRDRFRMLRDRFRLLRGKKTFDLRHTLSWNKGDALEMIRKSMDGQHGWMAVFVGDDLTDEEAFQTIGPRALTVRIGRVRDSAAEYVIPRRHLVDRILESLAKRTGHGRVDRNAA